MLIKNIIKANNINEDKKSFKKKGIGKFMSNYKS